MHAENLPDKFTSQSFIHPNPLIKVLTENITDNFGLIVNKKKSENNYQLKRTIFHASTKRLQLPHKDTLSTIYRENVEPKNDCCLILSLIIYAGYIFNLNNLYIYF